MPEARRWWFDRWIADGFPESVEVGVGVFEDAAQFAASFLGSEEKLTDDACKSWAVNKKHPYAGDLAAGSTYDDAAVQYLKRRERHHEQPLEPST